MLQNSCILKQTQVGEDLNNKTFDKKTIPLLHLKVPRVKDLCQYKTKQIPMPSNISKLPYKTDYLSSKIVYLEKDKTAA